MKLLRSTAGGFKTTLSYSGYPAVVNHPTAHQRLLDAMRKFLPEENIESDGKLQ